MPELNANIARYYFECSALPPEVFQVASFEGIEEISGLYRFTLELISTDPIVDFAQVVNQPAVFIMMRGDEPTYINGLVVDFQQAGRTKDYVAYRVVLAPRLWRLSLTYQSRIFQHLTIEEVITQVLEEAGLAPADYRFELSETYQPYEYIVQHQETDFNFICRLMEREGIFFFFEHSDERETLVITDDQTVPVPINGESTLDYHEGEGLIPEHVEVVQDFTCREKIVTGKVQLKDYNYETPDADLLVESQLNTEMPGTRYEFGEHYKDADEGNRLVRVRNEEIECRRRVLKGGSNCVGFRSGYLFTMENHYRGDFNEDYLLVWIRHQGSQRHAIGLDALPGVSPIATAALVPQLTQTYHNEFRCQSASQAFRPERRTPVPQIPGIMIADTEHPDENADDYGHIDDQGRYRARMKFDLSDTPAADATLPLRMKQPYSGPGYGVHFPNHHKTEMVWACVNGDPDRPVVLGTVPNPNEGSPSTVSNKWQSVIRTWGQNELTFDDKVGEENIYMFATKDHTVVVTNDESISVGHDQSNSIGNDRTKTVGHDETITVQNNRTTDIVDGNETLTVQTGDRSVTIQTGNDTHTVKQDRTVTIQSGDDTLEVQTGDRTVSVNTGDDTHNILTGDRTVNVNTGNDTLNVKTGDRTVNVNAGDDTLNVKTGNRTVTVKSDSTHTCDGNLESRSKGEMTISSDTNKITIQAATEIMLQVGGSSISIKPDGITISAPRIASAAQTMNEVTGAIVKIN
ncbi:MAG: type VI secretion system Vgr family protein [Rhodothermales bacterium]